MCGIFGVINNSNATQSIIDGLRRLEYRGYDSAGVATIFNGTIAARRTRGKLSNLEHALMRRPLEGGTGIGHTRWATHGQPTVKNAHPHVCGPVAVVHNGIIENHHELRAWLIKLGHRFKSQTDSEVVPHLIHHYINQGREPMEAVRVALDHLRGAYALGIMIDSLDGELIAARRGSPLVLGEGNDGVYLASDVIALGDTAKDVIYLENNDVAIIGKSGLNCFNQRGQKVSRKKKTVRSTATGVGKNGFPHYMLKEIHEQPTVVKETLNAASKEMFEGIHFEKINRLHIVACGTSYYAGAVAKYWFEQYAKIPVELDIASEFRYRGAPMLDGDAALFISQSGETADTLAALDYVRSQNKKVLSIVNVPGSSIARESDAVLYTKAGPEIGVASTKAFTTQLTLLAKMAIRAAQDKNLIKEDEVENVERTLATLPREIAKVVAFSGALEEMAKEIVSVKSTLFLGRGVMFPIALEGALKLKEITYIHAEGYASGELKHGPIALVDTNTPIIMLAPDDELFEKNASNFQEVLARGAKVFVIGGEAMTRELQNDAYMALSLGSVPPEIAPIVYVVALQLLAYYTAVHKGTDVDQPRNLAKSVTVE